jgi:dihydroxy-acid dehydratase
MAPAEGFCKGLTSYRDAGSSLFLCTPFINGAGYTDGALSRPTVGIVNTGSGFSPCHPNEPTPFRLTP